MPDDFGRRDAAIVAARYRISDYRLWFECFSSQSERRMLDGAVGHRISISVDDPRRVEVVVEFPSLELARRYEELLLLPHIRDDDRKAGVVEHGAVWIAMLWERRRYPSQVAGHDA